MTRDILSNAVMNAGATALYVIGIAFFITYVPAFFAQGEPDTILAPVVFLLLFIVSAAVTGFLVLGRPIMWYLDGRKRDSLVLFATTVGFLFLFALFLLSIL